MLVWVIDDESAILSMIRTALELKGHEIVTFDDPFPAMQMAPQLQLTPDVVFVDWRLGSLPGLEVVQRLRLEMPTASFVLMSGDPRRERELPSGVEWLCKPFRLHELFRYTG